jgi:hypothetical protein
MNAKQITRLFIFILFLISVTANADGNSHPSIFDVFKSGNILNVELEVDFAELESNRRNNDFVPGLFRFQAGNGAVEEWSIQLRVRGRFRRMTCDLPPLKLQFDKNELAAKGLQPHNSFKLVTHCFDNGEGSELILREYLAYQLYASLTDYSFRTQLASITYRDPGTGETITNYGILIEDTDQMEERLGGKVCDECYEYPLEQFRPDNLYLHALFQYMIGNADWSLTMMRNIKIVKLAEGGQSVVVPYDFDFSGLVDASYAIPNPDYKLKNVRERALVIPIASREDMASAVALLKAEKSTLMSIVNHFELLPKRSRRDICKYLNSFYQELDAGIGT